MAPSIVVPLTTMRPMPNYVIYEKIPRLASFGLTITEGNAKAMKSI
jgi:hypothetical protein